MQRWVAQPMPSSWVSARQSRRGLHSSASSSISAAGVDMTTATASVCSSIAEPAAGVIRRASARQWVLKPQDLAVALKLVSLQGEQMAYAALAKLMRLSPFEVHAAVQRLIAARLVTKHAGPIRPILAALRAFVISGAPYAYPPVRGEATIGFPTSHAVPPLSEQIQPSAESPPVWPHPGGTTRGQAVLPLYENLPLAAVDDARLYELLALFDALRMGQARERELAKKLLEERLQ